MSEDLYPTAPDGGIMTVTIPDGNHPWLLAALGVVIVVVGGILLSPSDDHHSQRLVEPVTSQVVAPLAD